MIAVTSNCGIVAVCDASALLFDILRWVKKGKRKRMDPVDKVGKRRMINRDSCVIDLTADSD